LYLSYPIKVMDGLENYQTYFSSSHLKNLVCHSLTSLTSKGCQWPRKEVKKKNLNERQLCIHKLLLHELWWSSSIQGVTYDPIILNGIYMWYTWDTRGGTSRLGAHSVQLPSYSCFPNFLHLIFLRKRSL
jgi:hypothetical protein